MPQGGEGGNDREGTRAHEPVLLEEALELVAPRAGGVYLDATFGRGGYTQALLRASAPDGRVVAFDRDRDAIESALFSVRNFRSVFSYAHVLCPKLRHDRSDGRSDSSRQRGEMSPLAPHPPQCCVTPFR